MPVTARLSRVFYDRFGEQIVRELVDWFSQVDATYRNDLRELNEINFARFDAKLEQRLAELRAELILALTETRAGMERHFAEQSRWLVGMWVTIIGAAVALWLRH
jgi:hypothetical protein